MKILMVNKFLYANGGSETYIFKLGEQLKAMGHEVQYFGMQDERNLVGNNVNAYTSNMNFHTGKLQKLLYPVRIIYSAEAKKQIRKVIRDFKPDVVHLNNINFQITPSVIDEVKKDNIPVVWTAHDYQLVCPNHMMYRPDTGKVCEACVDGKYGHCARGRCIHGSRIKSLLGTIEADFYKMRKTYRKVDKVICPSRFIEEKLSHHPDLKSKTVVMHNFIDTVPWKDVKKKGYVLYFGRYSEEKGINTLIRAAKALPEVEFVFAGKGPMEEELKNIPNVKNMGFQSGIALETLIREAVVSIYPSEWYENCPFSVMESQMYGTPVIGADIGGIPELIQDGKTGLLYESGNADALVNAIKAFYKDDDMRRTFHDNCRNLAFDSIEEYCEKLLKLYQGK